MDTSSISLTSFSIFVKFESKTILISIDKYTTIEQMIDLLKQKIFEKFGVNTFKIPYETFKFMNNAKIHTFKDEQLKEYVRNNSFFTDSSTYNLILHEINKLKKDINCPKILATLFQYFDLIRNNRKKETQIIISPYSANITDVYYKNIQQQLQYNIINISANTIIYLLIDAAFFTKISNEEVYQITNCRELKLPGLFDKVEGKESLKFFKLEEPYFTIYTPSEYSYLFQEFVSKKIKGKNILFFILKCNLDNDILKYLENYKEVYNIRAFNGGEFFI